MTKEKTLADKIIFIDNLIDSTFSKKTYLYYHDIIKEIERLHSIIKEVREYITKQVHRNQQFYEMDIENILEILKGSE